MIAILLIFSLFTQATSQYGIPNIFSHFFISFCVEIGVTSQIFHANPFANGTNSFVIFPHNASMIATPVPIVLFVSIGA